MVDLALQGTEGRDLKKCNQNPSIWGEGEGVVETHLSGIKCPATTRHPALQVATSAKTANVLPARPFSFTNKHTVTVAAAVAAPHLSTLPRRPQVLGSNLGRHGR